jgi:spore maturation protein CgeB
MHAHKVYKKYRGPMHHLDLQKFAYDNNLFLPKEFKFYVEGMGHEVFDVSYDFHPLQQLWALENTYRNLLKSSDPPAQILKFQIAEFKPDIIFVFAGASYRFNRSIRDYVKGTCSHTNYKLICFWGDEVPKHVHLVNYFGDYDFVIAANNDYQKMFLEKGIQSKTLGSWFFDFERNKEFINMDDSKKKYHRPVFIGDTGFKTNDHIERYRLLKTLNKNNLIEIFTFKNKILDFKLHSFQVFMARLIQILLPKKTVMPLKKIFNILSGYFLKNFFSRVSEFLTILQTSNLLKKKVSSLIHDYQYFSEETNMGGIFNALKLKKGETEYKDYLKQLTKNFFHVNIHRDEFRDYGNIRCFEVTGTRNLLFSDKPEKMKEFFVEGKDFVGFKTLEELKTKINYYRKNLQEAKIIAYNGYQKTLAKYSVKNFCDGTLEIFNEVLKNEAREILVANYDCSNYPISYDFAFFVEFALLKFKQGPYKDLKINLILPDFYENINYGIPKEYEESVDMYSRNFRIFNICVQILNIYRIKNYGIIQKSRLSKEIRKGKTILINAPDPHHAQFYKDVNEVGKINGFNASIQAVRYAKKFLEKFNNDKICSITLRNYKFDIARNSNMEEWQKVIDYLQDNNITSIVIPDTDQFGENIGLKINNKNIFWEGCFDLDLRNGLYESCNLNLFVNNGPATLATLNKKIKLATFKFIVPGIPHCGEEFIKMQGYQIGKDPVYSTKYQNWCWKDDDFKNIKPYIDKCFI